MQVTLRWSRAIRIARSIRCRTAAGLAHLIDIFAGHILKERLEIDLLLIVAADGGGRRLADDGDHRLVIHFGVVEPVEQMNRAGPARGHADAHLAGKLGVAQAINADISSCRDWMKRGLSSRVPAPPSSH